MNDLSKQSVFPDRTTAFTELQQANYKLWQWLDHVSTVWWGPGGVRILARENESGQVSVNPLPRLDWNDTNQAVGTIAVANSGKKLVEKDFQV
ncbi:MAG: hypothetical protein WCL39_01815 [Armatimonadota bacterium]